MAASAPPAEVDLVVVGGGIVGLAVARAVAGSPGSPGVAVLEREPDIGAHQTSHNSGVIHAGIYYAPGSLKARLCVEGARALYDYCADRGIEAVRCGKVIVAARAVELDRLAELERRARANGVRVARLDLAELREIEPAAHGLAALHSPDTGSVDFAAVARAFAGDVAAAGGTVTAGCAVARIQEGGDGVEVHHAGGVLHARRVVTCAGAWSDRLAAASGARPSVRIVPFRGGYLKLRPERTGLVRGQVYPVPDPSLPFLGVHATPTVGGDVLFGPTALLVGARDAYRLTRVRAADVADTLRGPGTARLVRRWWRTGARELGHAASRRLVVREIQRYLPAVGPRDVIAGPSGIRAQAVARDGSLVDDFAFAETERVLHVLNAPSPAATASLAIGDEIARRVTA